MKKIMLIVVFVAAITSVIFCSWTITYDVPKNPEDLKNPMETEYWYVTDKTTTNWVVDQDGARWEVVRVVICNPGGWHKCPGFN